MGSRRRPVGGGRLRLWQASLLRAVLPDPVPGRCPTRPRATKHRASGRKQLVFRARPAAARDDRNVPAAMPHRRRSACRRRRAPAARNVHGANRHHRRVELSAPAISGPTASSCVCTARFPRSAARRPRVCCWRRRAGYRAPVDRRASPPGPGRVASARRRRGRRPIGRSSRPRRRARYRRRLPSGGTIRGPRVHARPRR
jgi:hypothetical protein